MTPFVTSLKEKMLKHKNEKSKMTVFVFKP